MPKSQPIGGDASGDDPPALSIWERIRYTMVKPDDESGPKKTVPEDRPVEELEDLIAVSTDRERTIGLVAAPVAAVVALVISSASVDYARTHNQNVHVYDELTYVLLGMAALILLASWLRKRIFQGITLALFGVGIFQLKYTYVGFALPFVLAGAWYLVRAYRLQQELRRSEAAGNYENPPPKGPAPPPGSRNGAKARASKRYTPPR